MGGRGAGGHKSKGVNWNCNSCGNENWSWRETCNKCQSAKPASLLVSTFHRSLYSPLDPSAFSTASLESDLTQMLSNSWRTCRTRRILCTEDGG
jgi:hypothetical protein